MIDGEPVATTKIEVMPNTPAKAADLRNGDKIISIDGAPINDWEQMREVILKNPNTPLVIGVLREGRETKIKVTPEPKADRGGGQIGVKPVMVRVPMAAKEAATKSVVEPARVVQALVVGLSRIITGKEKPQLTGPVGIVREVGKAAERSWAEYLYWLGLLSAYLGGFNLVPFPALDGGRLMFLGYEAVTRRRPNARVEAHVHAVGLLMLLALIAVVSVFDIRGN
jgi:regulator of sigma E protease